ncbi:hypothetical protein SGPA1_10553 [Streptomyces misionensis JCM 4497]
MAVGTAGRGRRHPGAVELRADRQLRRPLPHARRGVGEPGDQGQRPGADLLRGGQHRPAPGRAPRTAQRQGPLGLRRGPARLSRQGPGVRDRGDRRGVPAEPAAGHRDPDALQGPELDPGPLEPLPGGTAGALHPAHRGADGGPEGGSPGGVLRFPGRGHPPAPGERCAEAQSGPVQPLPGLDQGRVTKATRSVHSHLVCA